MARIVEIQRGPDEGRAQPTEVHARVKVFDGPTGPIVQIDTFDSRDRKLPGKQSQTIQIDQLVGSELLAILQSAYG